MKNPRARARRWLYVSMSLLPLACRASEAAPDAAPPPAARASAPAPRAASDAERAAALAPSIKKLQPFHAVPSKPQPGEWRHEHHEPGQTFDQYWRSGPVTPDATRRILHVVPLGDLTPSQRRIIGLTADYMSRYFGLEVKIDPDLPLSLVPADARRTHPSWGGRQILSTFVLERVLKPRLPADSMASIAFTASDLWPGMGWNFVFGQASLRDRVGVWSIHRNGDPDRGPEEFKLTLRRTMKIAVHETGHMFSMEHCTAYACVMAGTNSLEETDRSPLWECPECMAKVVWATRADAAARLKKLVAFCEQHGLTGEAELYKRSLAAL
jgi:archaemetzincin